MEVEAYLVFKFVVGTLFKGHVSCGRFRLTGNSAALRQKHANLKRPPDINHVSIGDLESLAGFQL